MLFLNVHVVFEGSKMLPNLCSDLLIDIIYSCGFKDNCSENFDICRKLSKTEFTVKEVTV